MRLCGKPQERTMTTASKASRCTDLLRAVVSFMMEHAYSFYRRDGRYYYSDAFRRFFLDVTEQYIDLGLGDLADTLQIPRDTVKELLDAEAGNVELDELAPPRELSNSTGS
jgi:hypothetical protein